MPERVEFGQNSHTPKIGERLTGYGRTRCDFYALAERLKARSEWHMGTMWATSDLSYISNEYGELPPEWHRNVMRADYVVYSYWTPIAWRNRDGGAWVQPDIKYGATTTKHQNKVAEALFVLDKV